MSELDKPATTDEDIIDEARKFFDSCNEINSENRNAMLSDLLFLQGGLNQWDGNAARLREIEQRPCLTINKLPMFLAQVTNEQRQNKTSIKVHPVDDHADEETAEVLQGIIRHIEYDSNADTAYDTAVNSAAAIGEGYFRLVTEYCNPKSFDQDIKFKRIRNSFTVYFDPNSTEPDGSDAKRVLISEEMPRADFIREYPKAQVSDDSFLTSTGNNKINWVSKDTIRIGEYYRIEYENAQLCLLANGKTEWKDEAIKQFTDLGTLMPPGFIVKERDSEKRKVMWYKITGADILDRQEIKCDWIPVFPVYGRELDINGKVYRCGLVRDAKDPAKMYNVWMTAATEEIAMRAKAPYIGAEGQFEGHEKKWRQANMRAFPYLEYKPVTAGDQIAPPPQRQQMIDVPVGVLTMAQHANDDIKATTGIYDASLGNHSNEVSGVAINARKVQGSIANFHFTDNLNKSIRQAARCCVSMIPNYYDATRIIRIMGEDGEISSKTVNQPIAPQLDEQTGAIKTILNDLTVGTYDVTVAAGPPYQTLRQEAADAMIQFGQSWPKLMDVAGDKVIEAMDWPGAEGIAARIKKTMPPEITADDSENSQQAQLAQATQQAHQQIDQHMQMAQQQMSQQAQQLDQMKQELDSKIQQDQALKADIANAQKLLDAEFEKKQAELAKEKAEYESQILREQLASYSQPQIA